jgi:sugar phosphate isomerase/epimerase
LEVGCLFWIERDSISAIAEMGVRCGQLGIGGDTQITPKFVDRIKEELAQNELQVITVVASYSGESYANLPTVQQTVGFIPHSTRAARLARTFELIDVAQKLDVSSLACHIGFVPENKLDPDYIDVRDVVRHVCDSAARHGQTFALETGQEPARTLLEFIEDVNRPNLKVNFDPANMILYGSGDPHEAVRILASKIVSVHAKDGDWPPAHGGTGLGKERPLGQGSVDFPRFIQTLKHVGYRGPLCIEREASDPVARAADMRAAVPYLRGLTSEIGPA